MTNQTFKRKGRRIQFLGLFIILADAVFGFFMFRGDLGDRYLAPVFFPILMAAVVAFAACMIRGGMFVSRSEIRG